MIESHRSGSQRLQSTTAKVRIDTHQATPTKVLFVLLRNQSTSPDEDQAPVVQRLDNFIQWISHNPTVSICAKILVFPRVQANMHTLTTAKFLSVGKLWTTFT